MLIPYRDPKRNSGIHAYEIVDDGIVIEFKDGGRYLYTNSSSGEEHIRMMQDLAKQGKGLNTYINKHVRKNYERKLP